MEEEKAAVPSSARGSSSFPPSGPPPVASSSAHAPAEAAASASAGHRQRFSVELRPGETTIVSWKRLVRDANRANAETPAPSGAHPVLESRIAPAAATQPMESGNKDDQPPSNRFSAVIEKIERLYMGRESSDEEHDDVHDDDQYDTEDSFIDDSELNEYFEVEKSATKHNGFFVNRGTLERVEPSSSAPNLASKKRRRKDSEKIPITKGGEHMANELMNVGSVRMKAAARNAPLGKKSSSPNKVSNSFAEQSLESKMLKKKLSTSVEMYRRKSSDPAIKSNSLPSANMQNKDVLASENKHVQNQKSVAIQSSDLANKLRKSESLDAINLSSREKGVSLQAEPQCMLNKENNELFSKSRRMEKNGIVDLPDLNSPGNMYSFQEMKSSRVKEGSGIIRPKGTTLERAIRDLEKIVAACRPSNVDVQESDASSQVVKKRLPQEVKPKLAKVARLATLKDDYKMWQLIWCIDPVGNVERE
ncbi:hypothetical protein Taro_002865 [Colocasia esculenta]|uniref:Hpc2-related domain-containing protein n=1 Tax=Colocasia esculenta TaxID=4460 RepID=A0A843TM29_COLES|nr:hypothetical protein [Colocasia esculenta]